MVARIPQIQPDLKLLVQWLSNSYVCGTLSVIAYFRGTLETETELLRVYFSFTPVCAAS
jgi:hypothetical protein